MVLYIPQRTGPYTAHKGRSQWLEYHRSKGKINKTIEYTDIYKKILDLFKDLRKPINELSVMHGFECKNHIRITRGMYVKSFKNRNDWKNATVDKEIVKKYRNHINYNKYKSESFTNNYKNYAICFLSLKKHTYSTSDVECLRWATEMKNYTIFKMHPQTVKTNPHRIKVFLQICKNYNYLSKYTVLLYDNYDVSELINKSNFVYGSESSVIVQALISGKPCFLTSNTPFLDIVPTYSVIPNDYVPIAIDEDAINKFITWYYYVVCIDMNKENWKDLIKKRYDMYQKNMTDHQALTWENACKNGLQ
jgi:hypothetical protein